MGPSSIKWFNRDHRDAEASVIEAEAPASGPEPRVGLAGISAPGSPRRVLYEAEQLRERAKRASRWLKLAAMTGPNDLPPALTAGTFSLDDKETLTVVREALGVAAGRWEKEADDLEASVVVQMPTDRMNGGAR